MEVKQGYIHRLVSMLKSNDSQQQYNAIIAIRNLATKVENKKAISEAGTIQELLKFLDIGDENALTVVAAETLSCLAADDVNNMELIRQHGGIDKFVRLLNAGPNKECTHRSLLALRIMTIKEVDRMSIYRAGGIDALVKLLDSGAMSEYTEYACAALGNVAAGTQKLKDAIRQAGAIPPLVKLLREDPDEISAELAAVVLRNLSLQNPTNRKAIEESGGLRPLLNLLSMGQEKMHYPLQCIAQYYDPRSPDKRVEIQGTCCFDPEYGHLLVQPREKKSSVLACFSGSSNPKAIQVHKDKNAERYTLLRKLSITEPSNQTLELAFATGDKEGAIKLQDHGIKDRRKCRQLERIQISPCNATEIKGTIMRLLTRMHLEREFGLQNGQPLPSSTQQLHTGKNME